jgi:hypothetical protein
MRWWVGLMCLKKSKAHALKRWSLNQKKLLWRATPITLWSAYSRTNPITYLSQLPLIPLTVLLCFPSTLISISQTPRRAPHPFQPLSSFPSKSSPPQTSSMPISLTFPASISTSPARVPSLRLWTLSPSTHSWTAPPQISYYSNSSKISSSSSSNRMCSLTPVAHQYLLWVST